MNKIGFTAKWLNEIMIAIPVLLLLLFSQRLSGLSSVAYKNAEEAIQTTQNNKQYLFLLFYDTKGESLKTMESTVNEFIKTTSEKPIFYKVQTTDDKEKETIRKYGISRVPLPLLLVFAPNGVITGGFPEQVKTQELKKCFAVGKLDMEIMKPLQEGKIALVLLQNKRTKFNKESNKAANDFQNDSRLKGYVEIVRADPDNSKNKEFMSKCQLETQQTEATIVLLVPPGKIGGIYKGKTTKDALIGGLAACSSGGCSPGGCK